MKKLSTPSLKIINGVKICVRDLFRQASHGSQARVKPFGRDLWLDFLASQRQADKREPDGGMIYSDVRKEPS